jgi:thiol-disulfide isomerase/thioredoxin
VQLAVLGAAVVISIAGAVIWSRTVADGGRRADDDVVMDAPGEYVEPSGSTNPPVTGGTLPQAPLHDVEGEIAPLVPDGRPMVVNLWYSTCPPCARELPDLAAVHRDVGDEVRFVGVDPYDSVAAMTAFATERGVTYELLRDPGFELSDALGIAAFPVTLFVDPDGRIVEQTAALDDAELRALIAEHWG